MSNTEIQEGNKLICEFLGIKWAIVQDIDLSLHVIDTEKSHRHNEYTPVEYHSSWDWLMPVYHKLRSTNVATSDRLGFQKRVGTIAHRIIRDDIKEVFEATADAIQWYTKRYNQNKKP